MEHFIAIASQWWSHARGGLLASAQNFGNHLLTIQRQSQSAAHTGVIERGLGDVATVEFGGKLR